MTNQVITIKVSGIRCDNKDCNYEDNTVTRLNYPEYIDKPCPKCGDILLTQKDFEAFASIENMVADFNLDMSDNLLRKKD